MRVSIAKYGERVAFERAVAARQKGVKVFEERRMEMAQAVTTARAARLQARPGAWVRMITVTDGWLVGV